MTDSIGTIAIIGMLCLLPCSFICAGNDTDRSFASRIQRQKEIAMDWTSKQVLEAEHEMHRALPQQQNTMRIANQRFVHTQAALFHIGSHLEGE